jgi:hypothetical protein
VREQATVAIKNSNDKVAIPKIRIQEKSKTSNNNKFQNDKSISGEIRSGVLLSAEKKERPPVARHLKCPFLTHAEAPVVAPALADDQVWVRPKTLLEDYEQGASLLKNKASLSRHKCFRITQ